MEVFFGNLPHQLTAFELQRLVNKAIIPKGFIDTTKHLLTLSRSVKRLEFNMIEEVKSGHVARYGKAVIEPDSIAQRIITSLQNKSLRGHRLRVRQFYNRTYGNDRRALNWRELHWNFSERRQQERRIPPAEYTDL